MATAVVEGIRGYTAYTRQKKAYTLDCGKKNAGIRLGNSAERRHTVVYRIREFYNIFSAKKKI